MWSQTLLHCGLRPYLYVFLFYVVSDRVGPGCVVLKSAVGRLYVGAYVVPDCVDCRYCVCGLWPVLQALPSRSHMVLLLLWPCVWDVSG